MNALTKKHRKIDLTTKDNCIAYMHEMGRMCDLNFIKTDDDGFPVFLAKNQDDEFMVDY